MIRKILALAMLLFAVPGFAQTTVEYIHTDALGSPVVVTDANRNVIERYEYEPYGRVLAPAAPQDGPGFTGHVFDSDTGLNYMQQRYYDAGIGRFLSADPVAVRPIGDNFNRYWYANDNPYKFTDPDGRDGLLGPEYRMQAPSAAGMDAGVGLVADFTPIVGDVKGVYEAYQDPTFSNIAAAGVGFIPIVGDGAAKVIKGGDRVAGAIRAGHNGVEGPVKLEARTTRAGESAAKITYPDGSVKDVSSSRVKEFVPQTHPNAPPGTLKKVKFENAQPGTKGYKRDPTPGDLKEAGINK